MKTHSEHPTRVNPIIFLAIFASLFIFYSFFCWSIGYYMAKYKFKNHTEIIDQNITAITRESGAK